MKVNFKKSSSWVDIFIAITALVALYPFLGYHLQLIFYPNALEMREGGMLLTTWALQHGINPLAIENMPQYLNVYGILYNLLSVPFTWIIDNQLIAHKLSTAFFLWCCAGLMYWIAFQQTRQKGLSLLAALTLYACLLVLVVPLPRPETLGTLLFLGCLYFPNLKAYQHKSLHLAYLLGILSVFAKVYFVVCLPLLTVYLFLFVSKRKALQFGFGYAAVAFVLYGLVYLLFPLYWVNTLLINIGCNYDATPPLWRYFQLATLRIELFPYALWVLGIGVCIYLFQTLKTWLSIPKVHLNLDKGLFSPKVPYLFYALCCFVLFYFKMANNYGAFVYYALELAAPHFILLIVYIIHKQWDGLKLLYAGLLLYNLSFIYGYVHTNRGFKGNSGTPETWTQVDQLIQDHQNIFASPVLSAALLQYNRPIYDSGLSEWYYPCTNAGEPFVEVTQLHTKYIDRIGKDVADKKFDLIVVDMFGSWLVPNDVLTRNYQRGETLVLNLPHTGQNYTLVVWRPLH